MSRIHAQRRPEPAGPATRCSHPQIQLANARARSTKAGACGAGNARSGFRDAQAFAAHGAQRRPEPAGPATLCSRRGLLSSRHLHGRSTKAGACGAGNAVTDVRAQVGSSLCIRSTKAGACGAGNACSNGSTRSCDCDGPASLNEGRSLRGRQRAAGHLSRLALLGAISRSTKAGACGAGNAGPRVSSPEYAVHMRSAQRRPEPAGPATPSRRDPDTNSRCTLDRSTKAGACGAGNASACVHDVNVELDGLALNEGRSLRGRQRAWHLLHAHVARCSVRSTKAGACGAGNAFASRFVHSQTGPTRTLNEGWSLRGRQRLDCGP